MDGTETRNTRFVSAEKLRRAFYEKLKVLKTKDSMFQFVITSCHKQIHCLHNMEVGLQMSLQTIQTLKRDGSTSDRKQFKLNEK